MKYNKECLQFTIDELEQFLTKKLGVESVQIDIETSPNYSDCYYEGDIPSIDIDNINLTIFKKEENAK